MSEAGAASGARVVVTAGKGGVGKTTLAAATALHCARRGIRTLAISIDAAHNLADVLGKTLGACATRVTGELYGLEVDLNREIRENWRGMMDFLRGLAAGDPVVSTVVADECSVLPGMEEVFGLMRLQTEVESGAWEVIVVDAPPTADLLKFLRLPDVLRWYVDRYHLFDRGRLRLLRPVAEALQMPVPSEESLLDLEHWYRRVGAAGRTLMDPCRCTVRLVMTPEPVSMRETCRALNWTCLLGMLVDGIIVNRVRAEGEAGAARREREQCVLEEARAEFHGMPVWVAPEFDGEAIGPDALLALADATYGTIQPERCFLSEAPIQWSEGPEAAELRLRLPHLQRGEFRLYSSPEGLVLHVGNQRRTIPLPASIQRRKLGAARYEEGWLHVSYGHEVGEA